MPIWETILVTLIQLGLLANARISAIRPSAVTRATALSEKKTGGFLEGDRRDYHQGWCQPQKHMGHGTSRIIRYFPSDVYKKNLVPVKSLC